METALKTQEAQLEMPRQLGQLIHIPSPPSQNGALKPSDSLPSTEPKQHSKQDKERLALALGRVCELQKQFGKTTAELETLVEGFCWALEGYEIDEILNAMRQYVARKNDIPTPADIMNIIDPPAQPLSGAVYIEIKKRMRSDVYVTIAEREYCQNYENQEMAKCRGGTPELRQAQAEVEQYSRQKLEWGSEA